MANPIPIKWVKQIKPYYCGAASGVMLLNGVGVAKRLTAKSKKKWQQKLWEKVTVVTTGPHRRDEIDESSDGFLPEFDRQQCFFCTGDWHCWATTPQALRDAVNAYLPKGKALKIVRSTKETTVANAVLKSIDARSPAIVAVGAASHWVVVRGYLADDPDMDSERVGGRDLNGVYLLDPYVDPPDAEGLDLVSADVFLHHDLLFVKCASPLDKAKKIVIVKKSKRR